MRVGKPGRGGEVLEGAERVSGVFGGERSQGGGVAERGKADGGG